MRLPRWRSWKSFPKQQFSPDPPNSPIPSTGFKKQTPMKLHSLTIMAGTAVCLLAACSREQLAPEPQGRYTITAIRESGGTKTSVDKDYSLNWNAEDVIGVFNGAEYTHHRLALTDGDGTPTATFVLEEGLEEGDVFAYYPYYEGTVLTEDGKIAVDLGEQTFEFDAESKDLDNFGKYFYMTGKATAEAGSTNVDVSFRNPLSAFVFNLSNNGEESLTIKSVSVGTTDGSKVFGTAGTLDLANPEASEATTMAASASASLNSVVLEREEDIDIPVVVFPCDLSGIELEFTVTYTAGEDAVEQKISKILAGRNLARNSFAVIRLDFGENAAVEDLQKVLQEGGTYDLTCSITGNFTVTAKTPVTINLNGFTITNDPSSEGTGDTFTVNLGSNLTISGEGTVDNTSHGKAAIYNNGTVTLNGGTYTRSAENSSYTESKAPDFNSYYVILNHGVMTINEGVNIVSSGTYSSLINTGYRDYLKKDDERSGYIVGKGQEFPQLTIHGGTFEGGVITIKNDLNGTLDINGGNFTNSTAGNIQNAYITTISGGNFMHKAGTNHIASVYVGGADAPYSKGVTTINGGTFEGGTIIAEGTEAEKARMIVNGGSFYCNFSNSSGKSGYESGVVSINNGSFTIGIWAVLQSIAGFLTEDASITAKAKNALMGEICEKPIIFNAQEVDLNLNGKTLKYTGSSSDVFEIRSGNVSISNGKITTLKYDSEADPNGGISVSGNASLTIEDIQMESSSTCFAVADQGSLTIRNSTVTADIYAVTSNASNSEQNITVTLENSEFSGNTPVLLNIPSIITINRCNITGDTQGMVVRGGKATITDSNITLTIEGSIEANKEFADYFDTRNWGEGNEVNVAALTIGNKLEGSYQYPTDVSLKGNTTLTVSGEAESLFPVVYAHANSGDGLGVTFNYDETVKFVGTHDPQCEYGSSNIVVNGEPFTPATE